MLQLRRQIVQVELTLVHLGGKLFGFFLVDRLGHLLDQRYDVAHAKNAGRDPIGVEWLQRFQLLAHADQLDRLAGDRAHAQGGTAAGVTIHACQHDAGQADPLMERARQRHRVLAGQRVGHQQRFMGPDPVAHRRQLQHQAVVDMQAAGRIQDHDVNALTPGGIERAVRDLDRLLAEHDRQARHLRLLRQHRQLLLGGWPLHVERGQQHLLALPAPQPISNLGAGGGLAGALQADHQHHLGRRRRERQIDGLAAQQLDQLIIDDLDDHLAGRDAAQHLVADRPVLDRSDEILDDRQRHVGFEQRHPDVAQGRLDIRSTQGAPALQAIEDVAKPARKRIEHRSTNRCGMVSLTPTGSVN